MTSTAEDKSNPVSDHGNFGQCFAKAGGFRSVQIARDASHNRQFHLEDHPVRRLLLALGSGVLPPILLMIVRNRSTKVSGASYPTCFIPNSMSSSASR